MRILGIKNKKRSVNSEIFTSHNTTYAYLGISLVILGKAGFKKVLVPLQLRQLKHQPTHDTCNISVSSRLCNCWAFVINVCWRSFHVFTSSKMLTKKTSQPKVPMINKVNRTSQFLPCAPSCG